MIRKILFTAIALGWSSAAFAQPVQLLQPGQILGNPLGTRAPARGVLPSAFPGIVTGTSPSVVGHVPVWNNLTGTLLADGGTAFGVSVDSFGAIGNNSFDNAAAFRLARDAAGQGGKILFGCQQTYFVASTVVWLYGQQLVGCGPNSTVISRTGSYGNTFEFGNATTGAGPVIVRDMWFRHGTAFNPGDTALDFRQTNGSAHLKFYGSQGGSVRNTWLWRLPYQISMVGGSLFTMDSLNLLGIWDGATANLQEGIAQIDLSYSAALGICTSCNVNNSFFGGSVSPVRSVTIAGTPVMISQVIGSQYGIRVQTAENVQITNNIFSGMWTNGVAFQPAAGTSILSVGINGNYLDTTGGYGVAFYRTNSQLSNQITIGNNRFNGEASGMGAVSAENNGGASVDDISIFGGTAEAHFATPFLFAGATNVILSGVTIKSYNNLNVALNNPLYTAAAYFSGVSSGFASNNIVGGEDPYTYDGIVIDAAVAANVTQFGNINAGVVTRFSNQQFPNTTVPLADNTIDLGTSTGPFRFRQIYSVGFTGDLTGTANQANTVGTADNTTSATTNYIAWFGATTGYQTPLISSTKLTWVPSTGILSATGFSGSGALLTDLPGIRSKLTAARTYYVRTDGNNNCTGLTNAAGASGACAFLTLQKAYDVITGTLDLGGQTVTIQGGATPTFTTPLVMTTPPTGGINIILDLGGGTLNTTATTAVLVATGPLNLTVQNGTFKTTTSGDVLVNVNAASNINVGASVTFNTAPSSVHMHGTGGATFTFNSAYEITGGAGYHYSISTGARIINNGVAVTLSGVLAFTTFAYADMGSVMSLFPGSYTGGTITGKRYDVSTNAVINTFGSGPNYLPGNSAGTAATGGLYQ